MIFPKENENKRKAINRIKYKINKEFSNEKLKEDIIIIIDSREKMNHHIKNKIDGNGFKYTVENLKTGDYSFYYKEESYADKFAIERKNSIEELISSMLAPRFEREIRRAKLIDFIKEKEKEKEFKTKINDDFYFEIMIEQGTLKDLLIGNHRINVDSTKMYDMIQSRKTEYNLIFNFIEDKCLSFNWILSTIKYYMKNKKRNELAVKENIF
jgi:hypothetical protein